MAIKPTVNNNAYARLASRLFDRLQAGYERALHSSLRTRSVTVIFIIGVLAMLGAMFQVVQNELAPQEDQGVVFTFSKAPDHANIEYLNKYTAPQTDIT